MKLFADSDMLMQRTGINPLSFNLMDFFLQVQGPWEWADAIHLGKLPKNSRQKFIKL
jgi:hypothetical protein